MYEHFLFIFIQIKTKQNVQSINQTVVIVLTIKSLTAGLPLHTGCLVTSGDQCLSAAPNVVDGVVLKCPADTRFSPTRTLDADYQAGDQVTDMFLDKT